MAPSHFKLREPKDTQAPCFQRPLSLAAVIAELPCGDSGSASSFIGYREWRRLPVEAAFPNMEPDFLPQFAYQDSLVNSLYSRATCHGLSTAHVWLPTQSARSGQPRSEELSVSGVSRLVMF